MNHFEVRGGQLHCEDVPLARIAVDVGTPVYVYSTATLERHFGVFRDALRGAGLGDPLVAFAVKANPNLSVLKTLGALGAGADTVSQGEILRALAAAIPSDKIVFSGVGKTAEELAFAIDVGVAEINVESEPELDLLARIAAEKAARPAIAIRVNPDVAAGGHAKIATGKSDDKFGVSISEAERLYAKAAATASIEVVGLACHIGSQITVLDPLEDAFAKMRRLVERLRGQGLPVRRFDLGGGLGAPYFAADEASAEPPHGNRPAASPTSFAALVARVLGGLDLQFAFEPGRVIAANAGVLLSRVIHVHERPEGRRFLVLDAAMNDLVRPAMYDAYHDLRAVAEPAGEGEILTYDVVGPVCETGDTFARDRRLPRFGAGDLVALMTAGAYGASMSSEYNSRPLAPEVLVRGGEFAVVRPRPAYQEMLMREPLAPWL
jgi:diaminopimelate decarboxylase